MSEHDFTPELRELLAASRGLPPELVRQVADFAEFIGAKRLPLATAVVEEDEDDAVDLGGSADRDDWLDLSGVYLDRGGHSAIGLV